MQTLSEIRSLLNSAQLSPQRRFGQCFLHDHHYMDALLRLADVPPGATVLEVGPGTGSLTEELLEVADQVVAAEIDRGLSAVLRDRLGGREGFVLVEGDVLAGKHALAWGVTEHLTPHTHMVSNLPYNVATPLISQALIDTWRRRIDGEEQLAEFDRLTFTVQREVGLRLMAEADSGAYGVVSVLVSLLGETKAGPVLPPTAFWPRPKVDSQMMRIDFDQARARTIPDIQALVTVTGLAMGQRRKKIRSVAKRRGSPIAPAVLEEALGLAEVSPDARGGQISPDEYARLARAVSELQGQAGGS
jgi:16S rRNA (adenine1518-N6/adenine1519-N6)-dimethyltransferase